MQNEDETLNHLLRVRHFSADLHLKSNLPKLEPLRLLSSLVVETALHSSRGLCRDRYSSVRLAISQKLQLLSYGSLAASVASLNTSPS